MESPRDLVILITNIFTHIIILYTVVANGTYTVLILLSFVHVWFYQIRIGYAGLQNNKRASKLPVQYFPADINSVTCSIHHTVHFTVIFRTERSPLLL